MKPHHVIPLLLASACLGCRAAPREQDLWTHLGDGPTPEYENFYEEFPKYPDYGIAEYPINESYDAKSDLKHLRESLRQCRVSFSKAYKAQGIRRSNPERGYTDTFEPKPGYQAFLPFHPEYLVVAIKNNAEHKGASTFAASYKVAYIIPIDMIFSDHYDFEKARQAAYVDRAPFFFDAPSPEEERKGWSPNERYKWLAIERHKALLKKPPVAEPDGTGNRSQPVGSDTNRTSAGAGSGR